jgi:hypothetical protein
MAKAPPLSVFCSYSHKDQKYRRTLETHLSQLRNDGLISIWTDREIIASQNWSSRIHENLNRADIVLLLVSADFLRSEYCYAEEMVRAMERHEAGDCAVVPIIVRECDWTTAIFAKLQYLPSTGFIRRWNPDRDYTDIARGVRRLVDSLCSNGSVVKAAKPPLMRNPAVPPGLLALCDRKREDTALETAIKSHSQSPLKAQHPLVCIVWGDDYADHRAYLRRLRAHTLPKCLGLGPNTELQNPIRLEWPADAETRTEALARIASDLDTELDQRQVSSSKHPTIVYTEILTADWGGNGRRVMDAYLEYWNTRTPSASLVIALTFMKLQRVADQPESARRHPVEEDDIRAYLKTDLFKPYPRLGGVIVPELHLVRQSEVETYLDLPPVLHYCDELKLASAAKPVIERLYKDRDAVAMQTLLSALSHLLYESRRSA